MLNVCTAPVAAVAADPKKEAARDYPFHIEAINEPAGNRQKE